MVYFTCLANIGIFFFFLPLKMWLLQRARKKESDAKLEIPTTWKEVVSTFISLYPFAACQADTWIHLS